MERIAKGEKLARGWTSQCDGTVIKTNNSEMCPTRKTRYKHEAVMPRRSHRTL